MGLQFVYIGNYFMCECCQLIYIWNCVYVVSVVSLCTSKFKLICVSVCVYLKLCLCKIIISVHVYHGQAITQIRTHARTHQTQKNLTVPWRLFTLFADTDEEIIGPWLLLALCLPLQAKESLVRDVWKLFQLALPYICLYTLHKFLLVSFDYIRYFNIVVITECHQLILLLLLLLLRDLIKRLILWNL